MSHTSSSLPVFHTYRLNASLCPLLFMDSARNIPDTAKKNGTPSRDRYCLMKSTTVPESPICNIGIRQAKKTLPTSIPL